MKITQLLFSGSGGISTYFQDLISGYKDQNVSNSALFYGVVDLDSVLASFCKKKGIEYLYEKKKLGFSFSDYTKIYKSLKQFAPEVIVNHILILTPVAWFYAKVHGIPLISVDHTNFYAKTFTDRVSSYLSFILSDKTVFFYKEQASFLGLLGRFFWKKIAIVGKGINLGYFENKKSEITEKKQQIKLGIHCRIIPVKDLDTLIYAIEILKNKPYFQFLTLEIVGTGEMMKDLQKIIKDKKIEDKILFKGYMDRKHIPEFLNQLDIYVHTTFGETICYSIMEAQACGLPIISADVDGVNNVIENEKDGLLYQPKDTVGLAQLIDRLVEKESEREIFGNQSRFLAETKFSNEKMSEYFYQLICSLKK